MSIGLDPYTPFNPLSSADLYQRRIQAMIAGGAPRPQPAPSAAPDPGPASDDDESDTLTSLLSAPLSALGWIGESLDKGFGGRTIRGLLGGQGISSLAHLIPFSDTLGLTDRGLLGNDLLADKNQVPGGRELLEQAGVLDKKQPGDGFDLGDVAGIAAQAALDPAMWGLAPLGGLSALSKGGKIAHAIGELPEFGQGISKITGKLESLGPRATRMTKSLSDVLGGDTDLLQKATEFAAKKGWTDAAGNIAPDVLNGPLGGLAGFGLPIPGTANIATLGHGPLSQAIGQGIDTGVAAARYSTPARWAAKLFNKSTLETETPAGQIAAADATQNASEAAQTGAVPIIHGWQQLKDAGIDPVENSEPLRRMLEKEFEGMPADLNQRSPQAAIAAHFPNATPEQADVLGRVYQEVAGSQADLNAQARSIGRNIELNDPNVMPVPRAGQRTPSEVEAAEARSGGNAVAQAESSGDPLKNRADELKGFVHGTYGATQAMADPRISGPLPNMEGLRPSEAAQFPDLQPTPLPEATRIILDEYHGQTGAMDRLGAMDEELATARRGMEQRAGAQPGTLDKLGPHDLLDPTRAAEYDGLQTAVKNATETAKYLRQQPPEFAEGTAKRFSNDPLTDTYRGQQRMRSVLAHDAQLQRLGVRAANVGDEGESLLGWLRKNRFNGEGLADSVLSKLIEERPNDLAALGLNHADLQTLRTALPPEPQLGDYVGNYQGYQAAQQELAAAKAAKSDVESRLGSLRLPDATAQDMGRILDFARGPAAKSSNYFLDKIRSALTLFKTWNTAPWPANKVRDFVTGQWQHLADGGKLSTWGRTLADAKNLFGGGELENAARYLGADGEGLSNVEANQLLRARRMAGGHNEPDTRVMAELTQGQVGPERSIGSALSGEQTPSLADYQAPLADYAKLHGVRGIAGHTEDINPLVKAGRIQSEFAWGVPKDQHWLDLLEQGVPWQEASARVKSTMADFSNLSRFEQGVVQRYMIPFYAWTRRMLPWMLDELVQNPGGITAEAVKTVGGAGHKGFTPEQLGGDVAIPLSDEDAQTGNKKFLSTFDLPFESLGDVFRPGRTIASTVGNSLSEAAGMLNPLLKVPIELATNRQLYSGRELTDLKGRLGTIAQNTLGLDRAPEVSPLVEELVSNSPLGRFVSTAGKLTDPRKSLGEGLLNTFTGIKTSDVDMPRAREAAARDAAAQLLQGSPVHSYTNLYVNPADLALLSPEERKLYDLYRSVEKERQARAKAEKKLTPAGAAP